jgi:hypothetical protein
MKLKKLLDAAGLPDLDGAEQRRIAEYRQAAGLNPRNGLGLIRRAIGASIEALFDILASKPLANGPLWFSSPVGQPLPQVPLGGNLAEQTWQCGRAASYSMNTTRVTARLYLSTPASWVVRVPCQTARLALSLRALPALGEGQKPESAGGETGGRGGLGHPILRRSCRIISIWSMISRECVRLSSICCSSFSVFARSNSLSSSGMAESRTASSINYPRESFLS